MNNRFKFRVWDKKDQEYLDPDYYEEFAITPDGVIHVGLTVDNDVCDEFQPIPPESLIIEQCTGLTDKNGNLIYEGDLLGTSKDDEVFTEIYWCDINSCFMCETPCKTHGKLEPCHKANMAKLEITGNIHVLTK